MHVFVYGTLKRWKSNNGVLANAHFVTEATVDGYKLYNSGFPVAKASEGDTIVGEVWLIGDPDTDIVAASTLRRLDNLEGYNREKDTGMYLRRVVSAVSDEDEAIQCSMYVGSAGWWDDPDGNTRLQECSKNIDGQYVWG